MAGSYTGWCSNNVKTWLTTDICHGTYSGLLTVQHDTSCDTLHHVTTCHERLHLVMALVMLWASPSLVSCECSLVPRSWAQKSLSGTGSQGTSQVLFRIFLGSQDAWVSPSQVCTRACCWSCWCTPPPSSQVCLRHMTPTWRWCSQQVPTCCSQLHLPNRTLLSTHYLHPSSPDGGHM